MTKITICIGSSCHLKGSRQIIEELQFLIKRDELSATIELGGTFCMGKCGEKGVNILVNDKHYSIEPKEVPEFYKDVILPSCK